MISKKVKDDRRRRRLLKALRGEVDWLVANRKMLTTPSTPGTPTISALAAAARASHTKTLIFRGTKFKLKRGFWLYILDPDTGCTLFGTNGGILG